MKAPELHESRVERLLTKSGAAWSEGTSPQREPQRFVVLSAQLDRPDLQRIFGSRLKAKKWCV